MSELFFHQLDITKLNNYLILLDIDGTIVCDGSEKIEEDAVLKIKELAKNNKLYFCSNKGACKQRENILNLTGVSCLDAPHRKPSKKILRYIENKESLPLLIIGDKYLTDGFFAKNIGAEFIKVKRLKSASDSLFVKLTYLIDNFVYFVKDYFILLRPWQWIKNFFVFVPIFFAKEIFLPTKLSTAFLAFIVFCLTASAMYVINDIFDKKADQAHTKKNKRPIATGRLKIWQAIIILFLLLLSAVAIIFYKLPTIWPVMAIYVILNLLYSSYFKKVVILDLLFISVFYLLRVLAGGIATNTYISHWLILCVLFVTLLIIIGKRIAEFKQPNKREVLKSYSLNFLEHLLSVSAGLTLVSYGLYSFLGVSSPWMVYSTLFIVLGVFRFLFLVYTTDKTEFPEKLILTDRVLLSSIVCWLLYMYIIFYH